MAPVEPNRAWAQSHDVQFYDEDAALGVGVGNFIAQGARVGQPVIIIATAAHRELFKVQMLKLGIDPEELTPNRDIVWLDARECLAAFMEGGRPNAELFEATVGSVFERVMHNRRYLVVRAYGEMVDVLWRDGKADAAIALEKLWNALARKYAFTLLCAYSKESLALCNANQSIDHICAEHTSVLPRLKLTA